MIKSLVGTTTAFLFAGVMIIITTAPTTATTAFGLLSTTTTTRTTTMLLSRKRTRKPVPSYSRGQYTPTVGNSSLLQRLEGKATTPNQWQQRQRFASSGSSSGSCNKQQQSIGLNQDAALVNGENNNNEGGVAGSITSNNNNHQILLALVGGILTTTVVLAAPTLAATGSTTTTTTPTTLHVAATTTMAGPIPSAILAWLHFVGILGVAGGLFAERFLIEKNMSVEQEIKLNNADGIYGLSALTLLLTGYFRTTQFAKGWDYYQNEPLFWIKMSLVAILGGLSLFPALVLFRRDQARRAGDELAPLSDALVDRIRSILNVEILTLFLIPLLASSVARGVLYIENFPWPLGVVLYVLCLAGAGFKYGKEANDMMEEEQALVPLEWESTRITTIDDDDDEY